jgi:hypothetical protein
MSDSNIITQEVQVDTLYNLTKQQEATLDACVKNLTTIKESGKINESNLRGLINVWRELDSLRELFFSRLLNSLKRGDMILR